VTIIPEVHTKTIVGRLLRLTRERAGLTQQEIAHRLKRPQSFVSKYEMGERTLDLLEIREICGALETTLESFVRALENDLDPGS
jgi:transcriptional regulator with XRE-family HTH domain